MKTFRKLFAITLALMLALAALTALGENKTDAAVEAAAVDISTYFTDRDLSGEWDADEAVTIALTGDGAAIDGAGAAYADGALTITEAGVYVLSGALDDGAIVVDAADDAKVQLVLDGVSVVSSNSAALLVENADKVFVTLEEGSQNTLANADGFGGDDGVDGAIFSRDDIVFNGTGALTVTSPAGHGIVGKDDVKFASGSTTITASGRGIEAKDSVRIAGGSITITAGKDAIRAQNEDDATKGYVIVLGGELTLTAGGGAQNGETHAEGMMGFGRQAASTSEGDSTSKKGIKASGDLTIAGGTLTIDSADDALHSDADVTVSGGSLALKSGDDGIHANGALTISAGTIDVQQSYEGLEGQTIAISGGDIRVTASDDGLNAAGGSDSSGYGFYDMFASQEGVSIEISGGSIYVNASGDGIDSNGDLAVSGGFVVVSGPTNSGNGALDYNGSAVITGGTVIAAGASGMAENFGTGSTQVTVLTSLSGQAGTLTLTDASGNVMAQADVEKRFDCVVVSCPEMAVGENYTLTCGDASATVTPTDTVTGGGMGMGGMGFGQRGGMNGQNGFPQMNGENGQNGFPQMNGEDADGQNNFPQMNGENGFPQMDGQNGLPQMDGGNGQNGFPQGGMGGPMGGFGPNGQNGSPNGAMQRGMGGRQGNDGQN